MYACNQRDSSQVEQNEINQFLISFTTLSSHFLFFRIKLYSMSFFVFCLCSTYTTGQVVLLHKDYVAAIPCPCSFAKQHSRKCLAFVADMTFISKKDSTQKA